MEDVDEKEGDDGLPNDAILQLATTFEVLVSIPMRVDGHLRRVMLFLEVGQLPRVIKLPLIHDGLSLESQQLVLVLLVFELFHWPLNLTVLDLVHRLLLGHFHSIEVHALLAFDDIGKHRAARLGLVDDSFVFDSIGYLSLRRLTAFILTTESTSKLLSTPLHHLVLVLSVSSLALEDHLTVSHLADRFDVDRLPLVGMDDGTLKGLSSGTVL